MRLCRLQTLRPAIARKEAGIDLCLPGGEHTIRRLAEVINEPPPDASANESANNTIEVAYIRSEDCVGCALCLPVCPTDAIVGAARFSHSVVAKDCTGCKLCLPVCPTDAILMRPPQQRTALAQTLADYRKTAAPEPPPSQQCIRCNWCEEVCPAGLAPMRLYDLAQGGQWQESAAEGLAACIHWRRGQWSLAGLAGIVAHFQSCRFVFCPCGFCQCVFAAGKSQ